MISRGRFMDVLISLYHWLFDAVKSFYLFLYNDAGWIGISVIGLAVFGRIVNLVRRAHGR